MGVAPRLHFVSLLAANGFAFYQVVVDYLAGATGLPAALLPEAPDDLAALMRSGTADAAFTCGLPYVRLMDAQPGALRLLAAPVLPGARYEGRPVYFSDFVVRAGSPWQALADLRGAVFAYNQDTSLSGCVLPLHHLRGLGEGTGFFGRWLPTGSHAASLGAVEQGSADMAAIDSMVLAMELRQKPERAERLRVVASAGPLTMPPVVAAGRLSDAIAASLREALCGMHTTAAGRAALAVGGVARFAPVSDTTYADVRAVWSAVHTAVEAGPV